MTHGLGKWWDMGRVCHLTSGGWGIGKRLILHPGDSPHFRETVGGGSSEVGGMTRQVQPSAGSHWEARPWPWPWRSCSGDGFQSTTRGRGGGHRST